MDYFLLNSPQGGLAQWLGGVLHGAGTLLLVDGAQESFVDKITTANPALVFLDFSPAQGADSARLAAQLGRLFPTVPLVAVGNAAEPAAPLAALRAGMKDFVDIGAPAQEAMEVIRRLLAARLQVQVPALVAEPSRRGKVLAVLGARAGVGTSTLAVNLATAVRRGSGAEVLLLDLGLPARDGALYMNISPGFHFVEAVRNLRRFDQVFVQTALARHANGVSVLPLPTTLAELRDISYSEALALLERLRGFFDLQVIDLGGFSNADFMAQIVKAADTVMMVTEQSVGAIVSAAELVQELKKRDVEREDIELVVSRFDARLGLEAGEIAQRVGMSGAVELPDRREALVLAMNRGALLADDKPGDPYMLALGGLTEQLGFRAPRASQASLLHKLKDRLPDALRAVRVARTGN